MKHISTMILLSSLTFAGAAQADAPPTFEQIFSRDYGASEKDWAEYLTDDASASVTAAGILDIAGESVSNIENVRDFVVALKGFSSDESKGTLAFSIAPARSSIAPMNLSTYSNSWAARLVGSFTVGYAQGDATLSDVDYERRAFSAETSLYFNRGDDPVLHYAYKVREASGFVNVKDNCAILQREIPHKRKTEGGSEEEETPYAVSPAEKEAAEALINQQRAAKCREQSDAELRWNRSRFSISYGQGSIKAKEDNAPRTSLGRSLVVGLTYGFDGAKNLADKLSANLSYRRTNNEPVLDTLRTASVVKKDSSLFVGRLTYGSKKMRALAEVSDARSHDITATQRAFKQAIGLDVHAFKGTWLNFRFGKQRKTDGTKDEYGSIFTLSYSPSALLK